MKKIVSILALMSLMACGSNNENLNDTNRLVYSNGNYYIYYNSEIIQIPSGTYITKDKNINDYFYNFLGEHVRDEKKLELDLSKYFPHGIFAIQKSDIKPEDVKEVPTMKLGDKNIIDSIKLADILSGEDAKSLINIDNSSEIIQVKDTNQIDPDVSLAGKTVHILNANGINGFAKSLGESFAKNLKMNYIAENHNEKSDMSYVINHNLTKQEFNKFVNSISLKYIKVKNDPNLKADSDVVLITGNDANVTYPIIIETKNDSSELTELLSEYKPTLKKVENAGDIQGVVIKYNPEDVVIANKLLSYLPSARLQEDKNIKNEIIISTDR